jgi:adenine deaminase
MSIQPSALIKRIQVAGKQIPADLVIKHGTIVNVFTGELMEGDIAIADGIIAGIGSYEGHEVMDAKGKMIVPGFIDGHVHIESSMLLPGEFAKVVLQHGVTTVITDPHEIANVAGEKGIQYMLDDAAGVPMDIFVMLPSCVPATSFESNGAALAAEQLAPFMADPRVLGLAEVMDFPAVARADQGMMDKLWMAQRNGGVIDGHAAGISREDLNIYLSAGIRTDHESINRQEAKDRLELGMYLMIREGTVAKDLEALLPAVTPQNSRRCLFVTDDKHLDDLIEEGSVDHIVRLAIRKGLDPITAIQMATLNAAECFGLRQVGAVAPGYQADLLLLDNLNDVSIHQVLKKGRCIVDKGQLMYSEFPASLTGHADRPPLPNINAKDVAPSDLHIPLTSTLCNVIGLIPNRLVTRHLKEYVDIQKGAFQPSIEHDLLKIIVVERHHATGNVGAAIVKGFQLKRGAIASTVAHDSHNIVAVGTSDQEILAAIRQVQSMNGGLVVVDEGQVVASLALPVAGLMSDRDYLSVNQSLHALHEGLARIGSPKAFNPFLALAFLTLPVIPELKLTDKGLFEFASFSHIDVLI